MWQPMISNPKKKNSRSIAKRLYPHCEWKESEKFYSAFFEAILEILSYSCQPLSMFMDEMRSKIYFEQNFTKILCKIFHFDNVAPFRNRF